MRENTAGKWFHASVHAILLLAAVSCLIPLINIIAVSLSDSAAIDSGFVWLWPIHFNLEAYKTLFIGSRVIPSFMNSLYITVVGTGLSLLCTTLAAYALSRKYCYGRKFMTLAMVFTMMFSGGLIPFFLLIKSFGLINTYWSLWLPGLVGAYNLLLMRSYFEGIPAEIEESARIDGCGEWRLLVQIFLPLSMPVIATICLFLAVGYWNSFLNVLIFINDAEKMNLTVFVQQMVQSQSMLIQTIALQPEDLENMSPEAVKAGGIVIMTLPMLIVYPLLQKYFVKGVMLGAIKG
ncbi:carbohydrate ABC transporter permease [Paenibacillus alba]|uniref:Carbohydrate ABC transporter permease n=1 Tax=Paenibacillus alba TaxID=1197127 RepID=A0ABU6G606_9BACL|nr:carbohydrate ABC transporter permease [Paenibacillus alba]MEC0229596.1 carbohydrate ABC transporter permease [Paenibacillus alba]NQX68339.1 carbohydrate ABC transporter permease [Paenibacillus alba]